MTTHKEALKLDRELVQKFVDCDGISSSDYLDVRAAIDEAFAQPKTVNQFHPDYTDEAINEMTLTIQRQSQRIEELEQEASGQYMTGYEVARSEFQQRIQELENDQSKLFKGLLEALKEMVSANGGVAVMPTPEARKQNAALRAAEATIAKAEKALAQPEQEQEPVAYCDIHHLPEPCVQCAKEHEGYNIPPQPKEPEQEPVALPSVQFEKVAEGIEVGYDFLGGVDIRLGGEFVYVHINYDYRYTHNAARKALADQIVGLLTTPPQRKPLTDDEAFKLIEQDYQMEEYAQAALQLIRRTEAAHGIKD